MIRAMEQDTTDMPTNEHEPPMSHREERFRSLVPAADHGLDCDDVEGKGSLESRFDALIRALEAAREANDEQRSLLLDLQAHRIELEMQGCDLRAAQQALEISRDHYARLFDLAPVGYLVFDAQGVIREANLTAAELLGMPRERLASRPFSGFVAPGQSAAFFAHIRTVFGAHEKRVGRQSLLLYLSGRAQARVVRLHSMQRSSDAGPECFTAMLDITAEHEAEERQRAGDRLRQSVLDALPAQVVVLDSSGHIIAVNRAWRECAEKGGRYPMDDVIGLDYLAHCYWAEQDEGEETSSVVGGIREVIRRRRPGFSREYPCQTPEGERWFLMRAVPLDGELEGAVVAHLDITERRLAEEDAKRARGVLAQASRLNAVGILASSLVHELIQPLSAAGFFTSAASELTRGPSLDPRRVNQVLGRVDEQIRRASDIMERLRAFLRGREVNKLEVSLDEVVEHACELVQWFASDHKVRLRCVRAPGLPQILADPVQVEQVLVNLICNAVQAIDAAKCDRREVTVEIAPAQSSVELIVRDTGPGLPPERHNRLFDIFESTNDSNLGLGLAISRAIADAHGGQLWAEQNPSEGAVFHLMLPLERTEVAA